MRSDRVCTPIRFALWACTWDANPRFQSQFPSHKLMFKASSLEFLTPAGKTELLPRDRGGVR